MIYAIVGRTGCGKTTLAKEMEALGMRQVVSYTTRPKRCPQEDSHIFIRPEESAGFTDKVATTVIGEYEYFATRGQVEESNIYVIDPNGLDELTANMPDTAIVVVHVTADSGEARNHAISRAENPEREEAVYEARKKAEDGQFTRFEQEMGQAAPAETNRICSFHVENDFEPETLQDWARRLDGFRRMIRNIGTVLDVLVDTGCLETDRAGNIGLWYEKNGEHSFHYISRDNAAVSLAGSEQGLGNIMALYLSCSRVDLKKAQKPNTKIEYSYADASNYKIYQEAIVRGVLSDDQIAGIFGSLDSGEFFIPSQVGLSETRFEDITEDDHCWFRLDNITDTDEEATADISARSLWENFLAVNGQWDDTMNF